jgi:hypothetical protein
MFRSNLFPLLLVCFFLTCLITLNSVSAQEAIEPKPWPYWEQSNPDNNASIVHDEWDYLLRRMVIPHISGHHLVRYNEITDRDKNILSQYLKKLQNISITHYNRDEQLAYWINLYNAGVVHLLVNQDKPIFDIRDLNLSPASFTGGSWEKTLFTVEGKDLSLFDIHHHILRPLWQNPMINYGLACGAVGCPDLQYEAYTSKNVFFLLNRGASYFINHPRGVSFNQQQELILSSFYDWYGKDFAQFDDQSEQAIITHISQFTDEALQEKINTVKSAHDYQFNWAVNHWQTPSKK